MSERLEVRLEGEEIGARSLVAALDKALDLVREAEVGAESEPSRWLIEALGTSSAYASVATPIESGVVETIVSGIESLRERVGLPAGWTQSMLRLVRDLGRLPGQDGTQALIISDLQKASHHRIDARVTDHAERAMEVVERSWGSVLGTVGRWNGGRREIGLTPADGGPPLSVRYRSDMEARILEVALRARGDFWGEVERNAAGQVVSMDLLDFELSPSGPPVPIRSVAGIFADDAAYPRSVNEWLEVNRGAVD